MRPFIVKCLIFVIPIAAVFAFPLTVFLLSGEFLPASVVADIQSKSEKPILYLSAFTGVNEKAYKVSRTKERSPEIIVFGRSRTLTFRSDFFKDPSLFYNAGVPMRKTAELSEYLDQVPHDGKLKVMLLDLSNFFKDDETSPGSVEGGRLFTGVDIFLTSGWREVYLHYAAKKFSFGGIIKERSVLPSIGLTALATHQGYRIDGSLSRGNSQEAAALQKKVPALIQGDLERIVPGQDIPTYDSSIDPQNVVEIERFLASAKARGIYVIGYLAPYAQELFDKIQGMKGPQGDAIHAAPAQLAASFKKQGFNFYDIRSLALIGSSDAELYDAGHPTERATLRLLRYLAVREPKLSAYVDTQGLAAKIAAEPF